MGQQQSTSTASVSGLPDPERVKARARAVQAAQVALAHKAQMQYTEGAERWEGIADHRDAVDGQFPTYSDCSSFVTWCLWNGLHLGFDLSDLVNGDGWAGGYTGTMLVHGKQVMRIADVLPGDCVIYGSGPPGEHTAIIVDTEDGVPHVISHGGPTSPDYLPYNYRPDAFQIRRYI
jgi:hypothetical protein